jgi:hypothetical protein
VRLFRPPNCKETRILFAKGQSQRCSMSVFTHEVVRLVAAGDVPLSASLVRLIGNSNHPATALLDKSTHAQAKGTLCMPNNLITHSLQARVNCFYQVRMYVYYQARSPHFSLSSTKKREPQDIYCSRRTHSLRIPQRVFAFGARLLCTLQSARNGLNQRPRKI